MKLPQSWIFLYQQKYFVLSEYSSNAWWTNFPYTGPAIS